MNLVSLSLMIALLGSPEELDLSWPPYFQEEAETGAPEAAAEDKHLSLDLGFNECGLSCGNSRNWTGLRLNVRDAGISRIHGLNFTFWAPSESEPGSVLNGVGIGLYGPAAERVNGLTISVVAMRAGESATGVHVAGVVNLSEGTLNGLNLGVVANVADQDITGMSMAVVATVAKAQLTGVQINGMASLSQGDITGLSVAGVTTVSEADLTGIGLSGVATVSEGHLTGLTLSGIATVADLSVRGVHLAGLATVTEDSFTGLGISGLATVAEKEFRGVAMAGLGVVVGDSSGGVIGDFLTWDDEDDPEEATEIATLRGAAFAGYKVQADEIRGLTLAGIVTRCDRFSGVGFATYNRVKNTQHGVTLGLVNHARDLEGLSFQVGLLNHVTSNPPWLRWLPIFNANFGSGE